MNYSLISGCDKNMFINKRDNVVNDYSKAFIQDKDLDNWSTGGSIAKTVIGHRFQPTPLAEIFFSRMNMNYIQKKIKKEVYLRTNGQFSLKADQDETDLIAVMQAVYIDDGENNPYDLKGQLKRLNKRLLERIISGMITNIKQQHEYLRVINSPRELIPLPINANNTGRKGTLPSYTTTFNW